MMLKQKYLFFLLYAIIGAFLSSCETNRWDIDVSESEADIELIRFEKELFSIPEHEFEKGVQAAQKKHPEVFQVFIENILGGGSLERGEYLKPLYEFVYNPVMQEIYKDAIVYYDNTTDIEKEIEGGFSYVKHYYPNDTLPKFYTLLTALTYKVVTDGSDFIGVSLDMFLGPDYKYYPQRDYSQYQIKRFQQQYIKPQVLKMHFNMKFVEDDYIDDNLLSKMIYQGKMNFWLDVMAPDMHDTLKIEYSEAQLQWAHDNEAQTWNYMINNDVLYSEDAANERRMMQDAPFTVAPNMPQESAPRLGEYIGWQIVRRYMDQNPQVTPQELFAEKDYRKILDKSKYKPRL